MIGFWEIVVIVVLILLLFGPKRIPELARALAKALHEFKKAKASLENEGKDLLEPKEGTQEPKNQRTQE